MSSTDERIVVLRFDNAAFEAGVAQSLKTLQELEKSIDKSESSAINSLNGLTKAANSVSLSGVTEEVENASNSFSVLEHIAVGACHAIGKKAVELGETLIQNLGMENIAKGWQRYNEEISNVQMMVNAGYELETVENILAKLSSYADETSYSYDAMVDAIAKFTTYGLDLDESAIALQGFNDVAALMGVSVENAQHALTGLVGAMASGKMQANNWKWFQTARMTGNALTSAFIEAGVELGALQTKIDELTGEEIVVTLDGEAEVSTATFAGTLNKKWLTNDVMMRALGSYGYYINDVMNMESAFDLTYQEAVKVSEILHDLEGYDEFGNEMWGWTDAAKLAADSAQNAKTFKEAIESVNDASASRWKDIFKTITGDLEESLKLFTDMADYLYDVFVMPLWSIRGILDEWKELGGRDLLLGEGGALYQFADGVKTLLDTVKEALGEIFPMLAYDNAENIFSREFWDRYREVLKQIKAEYQDTGMSVNDMVNLAAEKISFAGEDPSRQALWLLAITEKLSDWATSFRQNIESHAEEIKSIVYAITAPISILFKLLKGGFTVLKPIFSGTIGAVLKGIFSVITNITGHIGDLFKRVNDFLAKFTGFSDAASWLSEKLAPVKDFIKNIFDTANKGIDIFFGWVDQFIELVKNAETFDDFLTSLTDKMTKKGGGWKVAADVINFIGEGIKKVIGWVKTLSDLIKSSDSFDDFFTAFTDKLSEKGGGWSKVAGVLTTIKDVIEIIVIAISGSISTVIGWVRAFADLVKTSDSFDDFFASLTDKMREKGGGWETVANVLDRIKEAFENAWAAIEPIVEKIKGAFTTFSDNVIKPFGSNVSNSLKTFKDALKKHFSKKEGEEAEDTSEKVGGALGRLGGKLNQAVTSSDRFKQFGTNIKETNEEVKGIDWDSIIDRVLEVWEKFKEFLGKIWEGIKTVWFIIKSVFSEIKDKFKEFWDTYMGGKSLTQVAMEGGMIALIFTLIDKLKHLPSVFGGNGIIAGLTGMFGELRNTLIDYQNSLKADILQKIAIAIAIMAASLIALSFIDPDRLDMAIAAMGALAAALGALFYVMNGISPTTRITNTVNILSSLGSALGTGIKFSLIGSGLMKMAIGVGIMALALYKLSQLDWQQLAYGTGALVIIVGAMVGVMFVMKDLATKTLNPMAYKSIGAALLEFGITIGILALAVGKLGKMNLNELIQGMAAISILIGEVVGVMFAMKGVNAGDVLKFGVTMMLFSGALIVLSIAAKIIATMEWEDLAKFGAVMVGFVASMVAFAKIAGDSMGGLSKSKGAMIVFAASMLLLSFAAKLIGTMEWGDLAKFGAVMVGFAATLVGFSQLVKAADLRAAIVPMIAFAGALYILIPMLLLFKSFDWNTLAIAGAAIAGFAAIMLVVAAVLEKLPSASMNLIAFGVAATGFGVAMLGIGAGLYLFSLALDKLYESAYKIPLIIKNVIVGLADSIESVVGAIFKIADTLMGVLIKVFVGYIPQIAKMFLDMIMSGLALVRDNITPIMDMVLDILAKVLESVAQRAPEIATKVLDILASVFKAILEKIKGSGFANLAIIKQTIVEFGGIMFVLGRFKKTFKDGLKTIAIMVLAIAMIAAVIAALSFIPTDQLLGAAEALSMVAVSFTGLLAVVSLIGKAGVGSIKGALFGVAALGIVILGLATVIGTITALIYVIEDVLGAGDILEKINHTADVLAAIGSAIGRFFGGIVGGFATEALEGIGEGLSQFMQKFQVFIDGANNINDNTLKGVEILGKVLLTLGAAELMDAVSNGILSIFGGKSDMTSMGQKLVEFADVIVQFSEKLAGIPITDASKTKIAAQAALALAEFANAIPKQGGLVSLFVGSSDIASFADGIEEYINVIVAAIKALQDADISDEDITRFDRAAQAGEMLTRFADTIPNSGGVLGQIVGENDMSDFSVMMLAYIAALYLCLLELRKVEINDDDVSNFDRAAQAGEALTRFADTIPNSGGILGQIVGDNDLIDFAPMVTKYITELGTCITALRELEGISYADVTNFNRAAEVGMAMTEFAGTIQNSGGVFEVFTGSSSIEAFGKEMCTFITYLTLASMIMKTGGLDQGSITNMMMLGAAVSVLNNVMPKGGLFSALEHSNDIIAADSFKQRLISFAEAMVAFSAIVDGNVSPSAVATATMCGSMISALAHAIPSSGDSVMSWLFGEKDLSKFSSQIVSFAVGIVLFSTITKGHVSPSAVAMAVIAGEMIAALGKDIPNTSGGLLGMIFGKKDLSKFADQIVDFAKGIVAFSDIVKEEGAIDKTAVESAASIGELLIGLSKDIPTSSGLLGLIFGGQSFSSFGSQLKDLGNGLADFSDAVAGKTFSSETAEAAINIGKIIAGFNKYLPDETSKIEKWLVGGQMSFKDFGDQIPALGRGVKNFYNAIRYTKFDDDVTTQAVKIAELVAGLASSLPDDPGPLATFFGSSGMQYDEFGRQLPLLGSGLVGFEESLADVSDFEKSLTAVDALGKIIDSMKAIDGNGALYAGSTQLTDIGNALEQYGNKYSAFGSAVAGANTDDVARAIINLYSIVGALNYISTNNFETAKHFPSVIEEVSKTSIDNFVAAFQSSGTVIYDAAFALGVTATNGLKSAYGWFREAGEYNMDGFINGMNSRSSSIWETAYDLAQTAVDAAKAASQQQSPSKVFRQIGQYNGEGLVLGMMDYVSNVRTAGYTMSEAVISPMQEAINWINSFVDTGIETSPVIAPVLDTSNIQNGMGYINGALQNGSISVGGVSGQITRRIGVVSPTTQGQESNTYSNPVYNVNIDVTAEPGMNEQDFARAIVDRMRTELYKEEAVWA